jgi:putative hydrolase of the HAD superfamily
LPVKAVVFDFYNTLAESPAWGPSWQEMVAEIGFDLPADVQDRWWNDGVDGIEHDEHSQSRDHYVAWQQLRLRGMLDECGVPAASQDVLIERARAIGAHRHITAYEETRSVLAELRSRGVTLAICSWTCDVEGPRAAGLVPLYLRRAHLGVDRTAPDDHHTQDVHRAEDLHPVLDLSR